MIRFSKHILIFLLMKVSIVLMDEQVAGFNSSSQMFGVATSLRETGEAYFNFINYNDYLDDFYRVRIDSVCIYFYLLLK
jgi:hypothetical protein